MQVVVSVVFCFRHCFFIVFKTSLYLLYADQYSDFIDEKFDAVEKPWRGGLWGQSLHWCHHDRPHVQTFLVTRYWRITGNVILNCTYEKGRRAGWNSFKVVHKYSDMHALLHSGRQEGISGFICVIPMVSFIKAM